MKVAYFEIYPQLALTPEFILGFVRVEGLTTEFANGICLLGGSMTTNIVSWLLALILLRKRFGSKTQVALKVLGLFGILDLPFYVIFPQIGLQHWIFLGGNIPEPLMGARKTGIPDPVFYISIVLTTLGLVFLYFKSFWKEFGRGQNLDTKLNFLPNHLLQILIHVFWACFWALEIERDMI